MREFLVKLKAGDYGLAKTYWLYGVLVGIIYRLIDAVITMFVSFEVSLLLFLIMVVYAYFHLWGLWNAAGRYDGSRIWSILGKILAILGALLTILSVFALLGMM